MAALPVFLVHYDAPEWVRAAAESILASDIEVALTVVSNSGPVDVPGADVVVTGSNRGYTAGANVALRSWLTSAAAFCVVGSHDLQVESDTLRLLVEAAERDPRFGLLGPVIPSNWTGDLEGHENGVEVRSAISGAGMLLRRECIREIGLFDPTFRSYREDVELCARARRHGWKVGRVPGARADGIGTGASGYRQLNSTANRPLLALRSSGWAAVPGAYARICKSLLDALRGRGNARPTAVLRAFAIGTGRLMIGAVRRPPTA